MLTGPNEFDAPLTTIGLNVTERVTPSGESIFTVEGDTHPHRHLMRELGGDWDRIRQHWVFQKSDPRPRIVERLNGAPMTPGFSDSQGQAVLTQTNRPHYWGHRQRLRDRFLGDADEALPDYELLELLLFFSIQRIDTKPLAKELLKEFGSLGGVINASPERLAAHEQINHHTIALFKTVRAFSQRIIREEVENAPVLTSWDKLIDYLRASMAHAKVEQSRILFLDRRNVLIADEVQHTGSIDHTPVYPREVVKRALALDASALIMVHNHPSNHPKPSDGDIQMTRVVKKALEGVGVVLHDHVIVSRKGQSSFKRLGLL